MPEQRGRQSPTPTVTFWAVWNGIEMTEYKYNLISTLSNIFQCYQGCMKFMWWLHLYMKKNRQCLFFRRVHELILFSLFAVLSAENIRRWGHGSISHADNSQALIAWTRSFIYSCKAITSGVLKQRDVSHLWTLCSTTDTDVRLPNECNVKK